ncbi:MAG: recombinase family protein, partial [Pseudomonadota bacterium]|nr:recombinase family protein [Pseudomonadota bacterium]
MNQRKAYSYLRFSTPEQMKGDSFRRQTALAQSYASKNNLILDNELTFEDLGVSAYQGRNKAKGNLGLFLEAVQTGLIERDSVLLVESLDRISRETARIAARTLEDICDEGVTVVTLIDGKEYTKDSINDPMTFIYTLLMFMRANEESSTKASRLRAAWQGKRKKIKEGEKVRLTSRCPAWIKATGEDSEQLFELIPERAATVKQIFEMSLNGYGDKLIAQTLNKNKVPTFGKAAYWQSSYISKIL